MNIILFEEFPPQNLIPNGDYRHHHIRKILHLSVGDKFRLGVINGPSGKATITAITKAGIAFTFQEESGSAPLWDVSLLVAQVRPICMKRILREAVSIGVKEIITFTSDTTEASYGKSKLYSSGEYWKYMVDGAMQAGQTAIGELKLEKDLKGILEKYSWSGKLVLDIAPQSKRFSALDVPKEPVVLAIGPERGWSSAERELFKAHEFQFCSLGERILRTETASAVALMLLLSTMGYL
ncbi:MAG: RsmE family RNA methyltransferase [Sphaerochaetaceae bacterium]